MERDDLLARSVREFVAAVASAAEPVPAGGSVAALTGATSAALLALVCGVAQRKDPSAMAELLHQAAAIQERLVTAVNEDAAAFRAYLQGPRDQATVVRVSQAPLDIATACAEVVELSHLVEVRTSGPMLGDVRAARHLAHAALTAALDIAEQDIPLLESLPEQQALRDQITRLRR